MRRWHALRRLYERPQEAPAGAQPCEVGRSLYEDPPAGLSRLERGASDARPGTREGSGPEAHDARGEAYGHKEIGNKKPAHGWDVARVAGGRDGGSGR